MIIYDTIKDYSKKKDILLLLKGGLISLSVLDKLTYYEYFLTKLQDNKKTLSLQLTADNFNISDRTVRRSILYMETEL